MTNKLAEIAANIDKFEISDVIDLRDACDQYLHALVQRTQDKIAELQGVLKIAGMPLQQDPVQSEKKRRGRRRKESVNVTTSLLEYPVESAEVETDV